MIDNDRLFPADPGTRGIARILYSQVKDLPLICPHGHTEPQWFSENDRFPDPAQLLIVPDHYILRMLVSQGIDPEELGLAQSNGQNKILDSRKIWNFFAKNYFLFRSTPVRIWFDYTLEKLFDISVPLSEANADDCYDRIDERLRTDGFRPRSLFDRFNIEVLATTDTPLDDLACHKKIRESAWPGNVIPAYRPDMVVDPEHPEFTSNIETLGVITNEDVSTWSGYLSAHRARREFFISMGATSTDHGHPTALTADLDLQDAQRLYSLVLSGKCSAADSELFRAQMLTEMAKMSISDGLVMQIHAGSVRNHSPEIFSRFGRDKGFDIPQPSNFVSALKPLLDKYGMDSRLSIILFTLDETCYSRELAPLAGAYPCLKLGPAWWFFDSPAGMLRHKESIIETAGYYNTVGFNDDTRAFPSIPARHDLARRIDCAFLANQVAQHLLSEDEAVEVALDLSYRLAKAAYKL